MIDVIGEIDQTQEYHDYRDNAVQQTLTQLNQMRDKRLSIFYRHVYGLSLDEGEGAAVFSSASGASAADFTSGAGFVSGFCSGELA